MQSCFRIPISFLAALLLVSGWHASSWGAGPRLATGMVDSNFNVAAEPVPEPITYPLADETLQYCFDNLDTQSIFLLRGQPALGLTDYQARNLDLFARQLIRWNLKEAYRMPEPRQALLKKQRREAAVCYLMQCDFKSADEQLGLLEASLMASDVARAPQFEDFARFLSLADTDGSLRILERAATLALSVEPGHPDFEECTRKAFRLMLWQIHMLERRSNPSSLRVANTLFEIRARANVYLPLVELGDCFSRQHQLKRAQQCYLEGLAFDEKRARDYPKSPATLYSLVIDNFRLSINCLRQNDFSRAASYAEKAHTILSGLQDPESKSCLSQFDEKIPDLALVNELRVNIKQCADARSEGLSVAPGVYELSSEGRASLLMARLRPPASSLTHESWFDLMQQVDAEIGRRDGRSLDKSVGKVLQIVKKYGLARFGAGNYWFSIYPSSMHLARQLSDSGYLSESDNILSEIREYALREDGATALPFVLSEVLINSLRRGASGQVSQVFAGTFLNNLGEVGRLRRLGVLYVGAGYWDRARFCFEQALQLDCQSGERGGSLERILLHLDIANLEASCHRWEQSYAHAEQALNLTLVTRKGETTGDWSRFCKSYRCKISDLVAAGLLGKQEERARCFLEKVMVHLQHGVTEYHSDNSDPMKDIDGTDSILEASLGEVYARTDRAQLALPHLRNALSPFRPDCSYAPAALFLLGADCATAAGDYAFAAKCYHAVPLACCSSPWSFEYQDSQVYERYLPEALAGAEKMTPPDKALKSKICQALGASLLQKKPAQARKLYSRACALLPKTDPTRAQLAAEIAVLPLSGTTAENDIVAGNEPVVSRLDALTESARLAQINFPSFSSSAWIELASHELGLGLWKQAEQHFRQAIASFSKEQLAYCNSDVLLPYYKVVAYPLNLSAARAEQFIIAEATLISAVERLKILCSSDNPCLSYQRLQLVQFYLAYRRYPQALDCLDQALASLERQDYSCVAFPDVFDDFVLAIGRFDQPRLEIASAIVQKVLAAELRFYPADDRRQALTYAVLGDLKKRAGLYSEAHDAYRRSLKIYSCYLPGMSVTEPIEKSLDDVESRFGSSSSSHAPRIPNAEGLPPYINSDGKLLESDYERALEDYDAAREHPYSLRSEKLLDALIAYLKDSNDYSLLIRLLNDRIEIARRRQDAAGCVVSQTATGTKLALYERLVGVYVKCGDRSSAVKYAMAALSELPDEMPFLLLTAAARIKLAAGDLSGATYFAERAENLPASALNGCFVTGELQQIWRALGQVERSDKLDAENSFFHSTR